MDTGLFTNFVLSLLLKKIVVPTEYHAQVSAVKDMLNNDVSGLIDSLTDFAVDTATVEFNIETKNETFTKILRQWLEEINKDYKGKIPSGIKPLAKEYFRERWKYSSFPVLKISEWGNIDGVLVPTKMFFVDGESIHAKDKDENDENLKVINYDYYLGTKNPEKLERNIIFSKPFGRWFDKYPTPYLIKRGIYHNYKIIQSLKLKETQILDQIIPYLLLIKKGIAGTASQEGKIYSQPELKEVIKQFQTLMDEIKTSSAGDKQIKSPIRATNFDEEIKHLIPDLSTIFNKDLFVVAERNILSGLGFIDVVEATSTSRRESILNPKVFIEEVRAGVEDFKQLLKDLVILIRDKNKSHKKYVNNEFYITASPIKGFMTDDFKEKIRQLYDRGRISSQTAVELIGEVDFRTEVYRREKESEQDIETKMYPPVRENREGQGIDIVGEAPLGDTDEEEVPDDKKDEIERENYDIGGKDKLETAPYRTVKSLPPRVKNNLDSDLQRVFLRVFNNAYKQYHDDTRAFKVAWSVIRRIARKGKDGKWHRKRRRANGKLTAMRLTGAIINEAMEEIEKEVVEEAMDFKKLEIAEKQSKLLDKLLKDKSKDK